MRAARHCERARAEPQRARTLRLKCSSVLVSCGLSECAGTAPDPAPERRLPTSAGPGTSTRPLISRLGVATTPNPRSRCSSAATSSPALGRIRERRQRLDSTGRLAREVGQHRLVADVAALLEEGAEQRVRHFALALFARREPHQAMRLTRVRQRSQRARSRSECRGLAGFGRDSCARSPTVTPGGSRMARCSAS